MARPKRTNVPSVVDGADGVARIRDLDVCVAIIGCLMGTQGDKQTKHRSSCSLYRAVLLTGDLSKPSLGLATKPQDLGLG
jgi:hypothetical protein